MNWLLINWLTPRAKISSFLCSFRENLSNSMLVSSLGVGSPSGKFWNHHWYEFWKIRNKNAITSKLKFLSADYFFYLSNNKYINQQESPPAWTQEAHRPATYQVLAVLLCLIQTWLGGYPVPGPGGYLVPGQGVPSPRSGGYPVSGPGGYPIPGLGVPSPRSGIQTWSGGYSGNPPKTWDEYPCHLDLGWGTPPPRPGMGYPLPGPGMGYPPT